MSTPRESVPNVLTDAHLDGNNRLIAADVAGTALDFIESFHWRNRHHASEAVQQRCAALTAAGADGAYFFNFCCYGPLGVVSAVNGKGVRS